MGSALRSSSRSHFVPTGCSLLLLAGGACIHDTDVPLTNDSPDVVNVSTAMEKGDTLTLHYPARTVCTLTVSDLNDEDLDVRPEGEWVGDFRSVRTGLGDKLIVPIFTSDTMGKAYQGTWVIYDADGAEARVPYSVRRIVRDRLAYPPNVSLWTTYHTSDTGVTIMPYLDREWMDTTLQFRYDRSPGGAIGVTGMYSAYTVSGDFGCSIEYRIGAGTMDGYAWRFAMVRSTDTSFLFVDLDSALSYVGFHLYPGGLQYGVFGKREALFTDNQRDASAGTLRLERRDGALTYFHKYEGLTDADTLRYPHAVQFDDDSLYVHIRMSVTDFDGPKSCELIRFKVDRGVVRAAPPPERQ